MSNFLASYVRVDLFVSFCTFCLSMWACYYKHNALFLRVKRFNVVNLISRKLWGSFPSLRSQTSKQEGAGWLTYCWRTSRRFIRERSPFTGLYCIRAEENVMSKNRQMGPRKMRTRYHEELQQQKFTAHVRRIRCPILRLQIQYGVLIKIAPMTKFNLLFLRIKQSFIFWNGLWLCFVLGHQKWRQFYNSNVGGFLWHDQDILIIIQKIVMRRIYGQEVLVNCHPYTTDILWYT